MSRGTDKKERKKEGAPSLDEACARGSSAGGAAQGQPERAAAWDQGYGKL
jgi:hypothetical protein